MSNERELKTIDLPSGIKAKVVTYFTRGEVRAVKKARWGETVIEVDPDSEKIANSKIDPNAEDLMNDELVFQGVKVLIYGEEEKPISRELADSLQIGDFDACLKELNGLFLGKKKP